jgi:hypothetical protein
MIKVTATTTNFGTNPKKSSAKDFKLTVIDSCATSTVIK